MNENPNDVLHFPTPSPPGTTKVLALSGGVGGAKGAQALLEASLPRGSGFEPRELLVVCNTGDDFEHVGLHVAPDLDSVMYRLGGLHDSERGWGRRDESWNFLESLVQLGGPAWFRLGDRDLATHVERTARLHAGETLSEITAALCSALGIRCRVAPMSDDAVRTEVESDGGTWLEFQEYFVKLRCEPEVRSFRFRGAEDARPAPALAAALADEALERVVICPSNPFVSVDPILAVPGVTDGLRALVERGVPVIAVSPIVGGQAIKGPAAKMMAELEMPVTATAVAAHYSRRGVISHVLIDPEDAEQANDIADLGVDVMIEESVMVDEVTRRGLARALLEPRL